MGGIAKVFGGGKKSAPAPAPVPEPEQEPVVSTRDQRVSAAAVRARRAGRRSLLGGGRLGGGEGQQTTLGAE